MKILITGGSGFVGLAVRKVLEKRRYDVTLLARSDTDTFINEHRVNVHDVFSLDADDWKGLIHHHDAIMHLAWYVNPKDYLESLQNLHCLSGSLKIIEALTFLKQSI